VLFDDTCLDSWDEIPPFSIQNKTNTKKNIHIQGVSGGIVNILGGGSMDYFE
jgi:hypothetical protein